MWGKSRLRTLATAGAVVLLAGVTAACGAGSGVDQLAAQHQTSEYEYSVIDELAPGVVMERAEALLGVRFVDLRITDDQSGYVLGILDLKESETAALLSELALDVPIDLETRSVPRRAVESLRDLVEAGISSDSKDFRLVSSDLRRGRVLVGATSASAVGRLAEAIRERTPAADVIEAQPGGTLLLLVPRSPHSPAVEIRVVGEFDLQETAPAGP